MNNLDFENVKEKVLPYFVQIYGEEYRDLIIERINHIEPLFYTTLEKEQAFMYVAQREKRTELTLRFLEYKNIALDDEIIKEIAKYNSTTSLSKNKEASALLKAYFSKNEYAESVYDGLQKILKGPSDDEMKIRKTVNSLKLIGIEVEEKDLNNWFSTKEAATVLEVIEKDNKYISSLNDEYAAFDSKYFGLKDTLSKTRILENKIDEKYTIEFLNSISNYTTPEDKKVLEQYVNSGSSDWYSTKRKLNILELFGDTFYSNGIIEAFTTEATEKLNNQTTSDFVRNSIVSNRVKYFEMLGFVRSGMTDIELLNSDFALKNKPKQEYIDEIIGKKKHFALLASDEKLKLTSNYQDIDNKINSLNILEDIDFGVEDIRKNLICIIPSTVTENNIEKTKALLFFSPGSCLSNYVDVTLIHEINHALELCTVGKKGDKNIHKSGFEFHGYGEERKYEGFSEIINHMISMEVTEAMHNDGVFLFDSKDTAKVKNSTSYEQERIFIESFWINFKKEIMHARIDTSLEPLLDIVGHENFERLNTIINEYRKLPYYKMMDDVVNKRTTALTEARMNYYNESLHIFDMMVERREERKTK